VAFVVLCLFVSDQVEGFAGFFLLLFPRDGLEQVFGVVRVGDFSFQIDHGWLDCQFMFRLIVVSLQFETPVFTLSAGWDMWLSKPGSVFSD
jgi:hypothetical protein